MVSTDMDSQLKASKNMETFTSFPLLPLELRRKIWAHTFQPHVLEYRFTTTHVPGIFRTQIGDPTSYNHFSCCKIPPIPVTLHVCHESRSFALEYYILSSGGTEPPTSIRDYPNLEPRAIYFNPKIDIVGFKHLRENLETPACWGQCGRRSRGSYGASPDFRHVKTLLINATDWASTARHFILGPDGWKKGPGLKFFTEFFPAVKEILLAQHFYEDRRDSRAMVTFGNPIEVYLGEADIQGIICSMEDDFRDIILAKIPGWKLPKIRIVRSRLDMTEVKLGD